MKLFRSNGFTIALALALASLTGCHKPTAENPPSPEPEAKTTVAAATPTPTPAPASPTPAVAAATPEPPKATPELAPPGVFYLTAMARVETDSGVVGLPPGTGVKLVRPGVYLTATAGEVQLSPNILTNDMAIARQARDADRASQAATNARLSRDAAAEAAREKVLATTAPATTPSTQGVNPAPTPAAFVPSQTALSGDPLASGMGARTKQMGGVLWALSGDGQWWIPVRFVHSGSTVGLPGRVSAH